MKFQIKHCWSLAVLFECELSAEVAGRGYSAQLGFAIREAVSSDANLTRADLTDADLTGANLTRANLTRANLTRANLTRANLTRADLTDADLTPIRDDLWAVLSAAPLEVDGLRKALAEGRVDGSTYHGDCACLVGTIAKVRGVAYDCLGALQPNSSRPIERFFMGIRRGDTPETNQNARLALAWTDEWIGAMRAAFGPKEAA